MNELLAVPRAWLESFGEIVRFSGDVLGDIVDLRVFKYFGETLRQAGILIVSSTLVIWGLVFIIGLQCGIEGAYFDRGSARPSTRACSRPGATCASSCRYVLRLHDGRQGRHRDRRRARLDADLR